MKMLHLCLQFQEVSGVASVSGQAPAAATQFSADPFPDTNAFGNLKMGSEYTG
jgi:hypothetical protein